jgi:enoyl-CoA hydratase
MMNSKEKGVERMNQQVEKLTTIKFYVEEQIAILVLDNPPVNALTSTVLAELSIALDQLDESTDIRAAIITGVGNKFFVAGADIKQFPLLDEVSGKELITYGRKIFDRIADMNIPIVCAVNGLALGGGCELALSCDVRIASANAKFGFPEVGLGIFPGYGGTQRLPRLVGIGKAKEMIFSGDAINAEEAYRIGLVEILTPVGESLQVAKDLASKILSKAPIAVSMAKKVINQGVELPLQVGLELESEHFAKLCNTEDKNEGTKAFMEKRSPQFSGR